MKLWNVGRFFFALVVLCAAAVVAADLVSKPITSRELTAIAAWLSTGAIVGYFLAYLARSIERAHYGHVGNGLPRWWGKSAEKYDILLLALIMILIVMDLVTIVGFCEGAWVIFAGKVLGWVLDIPALGYKRE